LILVLLLAAGIAGCTPQYQTFPLVHSGGRGNDFMRIRTFAACSRSRKTGR
jgi:hypothetical protein